jgi:hypothetical protein
VTAGNASASADFDVGQVAAAHLVVQQVAGQASQAGGFIDGISQPDILRLQGWPRQVMVLWPARPGPRSSRVNAQAHCWAELSLGL